MTVTESDLRARYETDFDSPTVTRALNAAVKSVDRAAGSAGTQTAVFTSALGSLFLPLPRRASSIAEVRERARAQSADPTVLAADDYRLLDGIRLQRLSSGTNGASAWGAQVEVDYNPEVDEDLRDEVTLALAMMSLEFTAQESSEEGVSKESQKDYNRRRKGLLAQVKEGRSPIL